MKKELVIKLAEALKERVVLNVEEIETRSLAISKDDLIIAISNQIFFDIHRNADYDVLDYKSTIPTIQGVVAEFYEDLDCEDLLKEVDDFME